MKQTLYHAGVLTQGVGSSGENLIRSLSSILIRFEVRLIPLGVNNSLMTHLQRKEKKIKQN